MKTDLVHVTKNEVFTDSVVIAEMLQVDHTKLMRTIKAIVKRLNNNRHSSPLKFPQTFIESTFVNKMNRSYKMYEMNEQAYMKLAMHLSGYERAEQVQDSIIEAFSLMKNALLNHENASWINARDLGKKVRIQETDIIKSFVEYATIQGSKNAKYYYSNITKMTNKALELLIQVKEGKPLRDMASIQELGFISVIENRAIESIKDGMNKQLPYKYIYEITKDEVNNLADSLCFKPKLIN